MLSKWFFIFLLALGVQNIKANFIGNFIKEARTDIISDITKFNIFYNPNNPELPLKGAIEKVSRFPRVVGFRGIKCNCEGTTCGCCTGINITRFNIDHHTCTNFTYYPMDFAIKFNLIINNNTVLTTGAISAKNPKPLCVPFYSPFITLCVRFYDIYTPGTNLHTCVNFEVHVGNIIGIDWPILILHFDCVKIGTDGISWMKPGNNSALVIMPEINGPEIHDPVDFEPEFPNNHASSITPEKEDNIGQLKQ